MNSATTIVGVCECVIPFALSIIQTCDIQIILQNPSLAHPAGFFAAVIVSAPDAFEEVMICQFDGITGGLPEGASKSFVYCGLCNLAPRRPA